MKKLILIIALFLIDKIIFLELKDVYTVLNDVIFSISLSFCYLIVTRLILIILGIVFVFVRFGVVKKILYTILSLLFIFELAGFSYLLVKDKQMCFTCIGGTIEADGKNYYIVKSENDVTIKYVKDNKLYYKNSIYFVNSRRVMEPSFNQEEYYENYYGKLVFIEESYNIEGSYKKLYKYHYYNEEYGDKLYYQEYLIGDSIEYFEVIFDYINSDAKNVKNEYESLNYIGKTKFFIDCLIKEGGDTNEKD